MNDNIVALATCESYEPETVSRAFDELLGPLGGLDWVEPGMRVAVKVNFVLPKEPEKAATTHPALVRELCRRLIEKGADVVVGDSPGGLFSKAALENTYKVTRMTEILDTGARLNDDFTEREVRPEGAKVLNSFWGVSFLLDADAIIDFCKLKTHGLMGFTGACKNMFGGIAGLHKSECHYRFPNHAQFAAMLVDLCQYYRPVLSICDGVLAMEGNGPSFGDPRQIGVLLASFNPHALDLAACHIIGLGTKDIPTLNEAYSRGLIPEKAEDLEICGDIEKYRVSDFRHQPLGDIRFYFIHNKAFYDLARPFVTTRPKPDGNCIGCGKCASVCPEKAIEIVKGRPKIDRKKCISCFCCGEFCPQGAMKPYEPLFLRMIRKK
ncbi:MAG: DUF362 domain-containing protein [Oscillospiraceae bacterium]|nr:DUF362 domain-containing protein [Oscillospiraceae bacterium]